MAFQLIAANFKRRGAAGQERQEFSMIASNDVERHLTAVRMLFRTKDELSLSFDAKIEDRTLETVLDGGADQDLDAYLREWSGR